MRAIGVSEGAIITDDLRPGGAVGERLSRRRPRAGPCFCLPLRPVQGGRDLRIRTGSRLFG